MKVKYLYVAYRKCILRHYDVTFCPIFLKTSIYFLLMSSHQIRFDLDEGKQSYGGGRNPPPPQVENVLKLPGEIGLTNERKVTSVGSLADILGKNRLRRLGFNIPVSKITARQAVMLNKAAEELPSGSDITGADDIVLQEIAKKHQTHGGFNFSD